MPSPTIHTAPRRQLRFENIAQVLAEVEQLAEAQQGGRLRSSGNWKLGQALGHMAAWAEYSYTGAPLKVPFFIRWPMRFFKRKFLYGPMRSGVRIPRVPGGTLATEDVPLDQALVRYQAALQRLQAEPPTAPNVIYGPLTQAEWIALNLRHAELHLSFFTVD